MSLARVSIEFRQLINEYNTTAASDVKHMVTSRTCTSVDCRIPTSLGTLSCLKSVLIQFPVRFLTCVSHTAHVIDIGSDVGQALASRPIFMVLALALASRPMALALAPVALAYWPWPRRSRPWL